MRTVPIARFVLSLTALCAGSAAAIPLDPGAFASLGSLVVDGSGEIVIYTDGDTPRLEVGGQVFSGKVVSQGGTLPEIAVFSFSNIDIGAGISLAGGGQRPLALLSRGDLRILSSIDMSGDLSAIGQRLHAGAYRSGTGPGENRNVGGGGSFGGLGSPAGRTSTYGDLALALEGGSAGYIGNGTWGMGGGAIELGAKGDIVIREIIANGGNSRPDGAGLASGSGSGGGILVHGRGVQVGTLFAGGGFASGSSGPGGGGRILVLADEYVLSTTNEPPYLLAYGGESVGTSSLPSGQDGTAAFRAKRLAIPAGRIVAVEDVPALLQVSHLEIGNEIAVRAGGALMTRGAFATDRLITVEAGGGFTAGSTLQIGRTLTLRGTAMALGKVDASAFVVLDGGTFTVPAGFSGHSTVVGHGTMTGPVSGDVGSVLIASSGVLTVGDADRQGALDWQGAIRVQSFPVNRATLVLLDKGSVRLPDTRFTGSGSRLVTLNGATLAPGHSVIAEGAGRIGGAFRNDGLVQGPASEGYLELEDDVTGAGRFAGRVRFTGSFAPGASPALVTADTLAFGNRNTLVMELAGRTRGIGYDAIDANGTIDLDGVLDVVLLPTDGILFLPAAGDAFDLLRAGTLRGNFAAVALPALDPGLTWHWSIVDGIDQDVFRLSVAAVPEPGTWLLMAGGMVVLAVRSLRARRGTIPGPAQAPAT